MEIACYATGPSKRIRIVIQYIDSWRPIFWLEVKKDGSVYLGPRFENIISMKKG